MYCSAGRGYSYLRGITDCEFVRNSSFVDIWVNGKYLMGIGLDELKAFLLLDSNQGDRAEGKVNMSWAADKATAFREYSEELDRIEKWNKIANEGNFKEIPE